MRQIQPVRHAMIKQYFDKYKYQKKKRELLFEALKESEEHTKEILEDDFVPF